MREFVSVFNIPFTQFIGASTCLCDVIVMAMSQMGENSATKKQYFCYDIYVCV